MPGIHWHSSCGRFSISLDTSLTLGPAFSYRGESWKCLRSCSQCLYREVFLMQYSHTHKYPKKPEKKSSLKLSCPLSFCASSRIKYSRLVCSLETINSCELWINYVYYWCQSWRVSWVEFTPSQQLKLHHRESLAWRSVCENIFNNTHVASWHDSLLQVNNPPTPFCASKNRLQ